MKCKLILTVGTWETELSLETDSASPYTNEDILLVLQDNPQELDRLSKNLFSQALNVSTIKDINVNDLMKKEGLVGNCRLDALRDNPEFDNIPDGDANILLVDNLEIGKKNIYGRIKNSNGEEVFIIKNNKEDVEKLSNFLRVRNLIREAGLNIDETSPYFTPFKEIIKSLKDENIKDFSDLILDFMYNNKRYSKKYITNSNNELVSVASLLTLFIKESKDWTMPTRFSDKFIDNLNIQKNIIDKGKAFISYANLFGLLNNYAPSLLEDYGLKNLTKMLELFSKPSNELIDIISNIDTTYKNGFDFILSLLFNSEPDFTYKYSELSSKGIILKQTFTPLELKYGFTYDTISTMDIINPNYRGYKIYKYDNNGTPLFFISKGYLTEKSSSLTFTSEEDAIKKIDNDLKFLSLKNNSLIEFKFRDSFKNENGLIIYDNSLNTETIDSLTPLIEGSIIEVLDIPLSKNIEIYGPENELINSSKSTLEKFLNYIKSLLIDNDVKLNILLNLNSPEKAYTFIYKLNELLGIDRTNSEKINEIFETINKASTKAYYIEKKTKVSNDKFRYRIIPTEPNVVQEYKLKKNYPSVKWIEAISEVMKNLFGITVHAMSSSEIKEKLNNVADPNLDKAFIYNGEIYINTTIAKTTDLLHEYTHLILGIMKSNPELIRNYEELLNLVVSTTEGREMFDNLQDIYQDLSVMDIREEVFAKLFSGYIRNEITMETKLLFLATEKELLNITENIFLTPITNIQNFYGKHAKTIFSKFSKLFAKYLSEDGKLDFGNILESRRYSNYISREIENKNIELYCP